jgi:hypothetical protein
VDVGQAGGHARQSRQLAWQAMAGTEAFGTVNRARPVSGDLDVGKFANRGRQQCA